MSRTSFDNFVVFSHDLVTKHSPKRYVDFSIELEYFILKHLESRGVTHVPSITDYTFETETGESRLEMKKIDGRLLYQVLEEPMDDQTLYYLALNLLYALNEIHEQNVTHGDIHGENIIVAAADEPVNRWRAGGKVIEIPSVGMKPFFIDFGLGHHPDVLFRADLGTTYAGVVTGLTENRQGDVIALIRLLTRSDGNPAFLEELARNLPTERDPVFVAVDEQITRRLRCHPYANKWTHRFFTAEFYNIVRCFPFDEIHDDAQLEGALKRMFKFLYRHGYKREPALLFKKIKAWHFEKHLFQGLKASSSVVNYLVARYTADALEQIEEYYQPVPYKTVSDAIEILNQ